MAAAREECAQLAPSASVHTSLTPVRWRGRRRPRASPLIIERVGRRSNPTVWRAAGGWGVLDCSLFATHVSTHMFQGYRYYGVNGAVFRARHIAMGVVVALKLM